MNEYIVVCKDFVLTVYNMEDAIMEANECGGSVVWFDADQTYFEPVWRILNPKVENVYES